MSLNAALLHAYLNSHYRVDLPSGACLLQTGQHSAQMDAFLHSEKSERACFVSAHNPYSRVLPAAINQTRHAALEQVLIARKLRYLTGVGHCTETMSAWPPEPGFLVLNLSATAAKALGRSAGQHAVVHVERSQAAQLLLCAE